MRPLPPSAREVIREFGRALCANSLNATWHAANADWLCPAACYRLAMATEDPDATPERQKTDESLRLEREKADHALAETKEAIEEDADAVVRRARETADAVVVAARNKADEQADQAAPHAIPSAAIAEDRVAEEKALRDERAAADESVRREREESARVLTRHLPLEREATDKYLLTERARSDEELAQRDDFLGMVCHDLRDLLGGIVMSSALLSRKLAKHDDSEQALAETARIQRYASRMNRLIADLVDVASIDAGKLAVVPASDDAAALVAEAVDALHAAASAKGVSLEAEGTEPALTADFDHDRLLQVLANLIGNSIKFTPKGGSIRVCCARAGEAELTFCVSDTGQGIPADMLVAVFERFWQAGKDDRRGLGLGLYISRCIVEAHGGKIWAESKLGAGSRISFTLSPAAKHDS